MTTCGFSGAGFAKPHTAECAVFVDNHVLEGTGNVQQDGHDHHPRKDQVQGGKQLSCGFILAHKRQGLTKGPPDRGKTCGGSMVDPTREGGHNE